MFPISALIYIVYTLVITTLAYLSTKAKSRPLAIFVWFVTVMFWGLRDGIGFDYIGYVEIFQDIQNDHDSSVELLFYFLSKLFAPFKNGYVAVLLTYTALTYYFLFVGFWKLKIFWQGIFFSIIFQFQFMAANQVRQALAIAIFLYSIPYILNNQKVKFFITIILTCIFVHFSAVILFICFPLYKIRLNNNLWIFLVVVSYLLSLVGIFSSLGNLVLNSLPIPEVYKHFLNSSWINNEVIGFSIVQLFNMSITVFLILNSKYIKYEGLITLLASGFIFYSVFIEYHLFLRLSFYFVYINIICAGLFVKNDRYNKSSLLNMICFLFFFMICIQATNMHGVLPYNTILV